MRPLALLTALPLCAALCAPVPAAGGACRQALALGLDVSGSVDGAEYRLQLEGLAAALTHPDVTRALLAAAGAPVRIAVFEWSGPTSQAVVVDWTEITDAGALDEVVRRLEANRRLPADPSTALGTALLVGGRMLAQQSDCWKRTLDISGDGVSNTGPRPQDLAAAPELDGVTVNALVIGPTAIDPPTTGPQGGSAGILGYFEAFVIRGPGAFAEHAEDFTAYQAAMVRKLLKELQGIVVGAAGSPPRPMDRAAAAPAVMATGPGMLPAARATMPSGPGTRPSGHGKPSSARDLLPFGHGKLSSAPSLLPSEQALPSSRALMMPSGLGLSSAGLDSIAGPARATAFALPAGPRAEADPEATAFAARPLH